MILQKTAKALQELQPGSRSLPQRARSILLMAGGKTLEDLQRMLGSDHAELAQQLIEQGYLQLQPDSPAAPSAPRSAAPHSQNTASPSLAPVKNQPRREEPDAAAPPTMPSATASINMAGTRMYLFDMCERLFANRHEALAQQLRSQLRESRDLLSLQVAALALLASVEEVGGKERADTLRESLGALLAYAPDLAEGDVEEPGAAQNRVAQPRAAQPQVQAEEMSLA